MHHNLSFLCRTIQEEKISEFNPLFVVLGKLQEIYTLDPNSYSKNKS